MRKTMIAIAAVAALGIASPCIATAAPRGDFGGDRLGPGIDLRSPQPGDSACWVRGRVQTPGGLRWGLVYTCLQE